MSLNELIKSLQEINKKYDLLKTRYDELNTFCTNTYNGLYEERLNLQSSLLCSDCRQRLSKEKGGCVELCSHCSSILQGTRNGRSLDDPST